MDKLEREDVLQIARHSNISQQALSEALKENVYAARKDWYKFLRIFLISLGVGFTVAGIIFFFAYNWADLNKFIKLGIIELLIISSVCIALFAKLNQLVKQVLITGASVLVGVLFAVFGQIYQTGANAYDFFLGWTMGISLWVFISAFPPLWLVYLILINTTINLYAEQVASHWSTVFLFLLLFCVNATSYIISLSIKKIKQHSKVPVWFNNSLALAAIVPATLGCSIGIFNEYSNEFLAIISLTAIAFGLGIYFGYLFKSGFLLSAIPFSIIIICSSLFIKISDNEGMFLFTSLFIIVSVTLVIKNLIHLYKKWNHEQAAAN
jgi:uncharacterized membrane protein